MSSLLGIANSSTERIQRLISSLLDVNRLEMGQTIVTQKHVSPETIIQEAIEAVTPSMSMREQKAYKKLEKNLPKIWVDEDMIRRVFINLLENASKFTQSEGEITVGAEADDEWLRFWVSDNGIGIAFEDRDHIFEKFTRAKNGQKAVGLGIGLAFCRLAVNGHGGKIWIDEQQKKGTRFNIKLPIAKK